LSIFWADKFLADGGRPSHDSTRTGTVKGNYSGQQLVVRHAAEWRTSALCVRDYERPA